MSQPTVQYEKNAELFADYQTPYKLNRPILAPSGEPGSIDSKHAHKPCVIYHNGALYHFYCAVRPTETEEERRKFGKEFRCLTVARSTPF